jgi:hypothetical protein
MRIRPQLGRHRGPPTPNCLKDKRDDIGRDEGDEVPFGFEEGVSRTETGDAVPEDGVGPCGEEGGPEDEAGARTPVSEGSGDTSEASGGTGGKRKERTVGRERTTGVVGREERRAEVGEEGEQSRSRRETKRGGAVKASGDSEERVKSNSAKRPQRGHGKQREQRQSQQRNRVVNQDMNPGPKWNWAWGRLNTRPPHAVWCRAALRRLTSRSA